MTPEAIATVARETILTLIVISAPVMIISLVIGLVIGLIQALTSIQESTLTFVPKILLVFASMILLLPFMAERLNNLNTELYARIVDPSGAIVGAAPIESTQAP